MGEMNVLNLASAALFAQASPSNPDGATGLLTMLISDPGRIAVFIPIVAIVVFGGAGIIAQIIKHRERMAMIERGINPDTVTSSDEE